MTTHGRPVFLSLDAAELGYSNRAVLSGVSISIDAGEIAAIIGPNGSGKSTLLKSLAGVIALRSGTLKFHAASGLPEIGYVPQSSRFDPIFPLTAAEVVAMGGYPVSARQCRVLAADALERVGLAPIAARSFFELSGGQKQRVLIARALVRSPAILLLDEPTAGVDPGAEQLILELLRSVNRECGVTVVMASHHLRSLRGFADSVIVVHESGVIKGDAAELLSPSRTEELFGFLR